MLGTPALTSRGFLEDDFVKVAEFFDAAVTLAVKIKAETKGVQICSQLHLLFHYSIIFTSDDSATLACLHNFTRNTYNLTSITWNHQLHHVTGA